MKNNRDIILLAVALVVSIVIIVMPKKKKDKAEQSGFGGASTRDVFKDSSYAKNSEAKGISQLYKLSDYYKEEAGIIRDFTPVEIKRTRILDGNKYYNIYGEEWISANDVQNRQ